MSWNIEWKLAHLTNTPITLVARRVDRVKGIFEKFRRRLGSAMNWSVDKLMLIDEIWRLYL